MSPSPELLFFEPAPWIVPVPATPVASTAPPLRTTRPAVLAIAMARSKYSQHHRLPGDDLSRIRLHRNPRSVGGNAMAGSRGVRPRWLCDRVCPGCRPHALSLALCTAGLFAAGRVISDGGSRFAVLAGLLLGLAAGVRYQNVIVIAAVAFALSFFATKRWRVLAVYAASAPTAVCQRRVQISASFGSWNPISKGNSYLSTPLTRSAGPNAFDPMVMLWARLVDFSAGTQLVGRSIEGWLGYDPTTGAHLMLRALPAKGVSAVCAVGGSRVHLHGLGLGSTLAFSGSRTTTLASVLYRFDRCYGRFCHS